MSGSSRTGALLMGLAALAGLALSLYKYITPLTGIDGTPGALLVIVSTTLLALAALVLRMDDVGRGVRGFFLVASLLDIAGTAFAGWLLEMPGLVALMALAFLGWLMLLTRRRTAAA